MRTKTLFLAAAALVAGIATSSAQVFSVNAVGYVNVDAPAGFSMIANPLNNGGNTLDEVLPSVPIGTSIFKFNSTAGSYDSSVNFGTWSPSMTLNPGEGAFISLGAATTLTFVGEVPQGDLSNPVPAGFSIRSSQVPQSGNLDTDLGFPAAIGDTIYFFRGGTYVSSVYFGTFSPAAVPAVGEAFFVQKVAAADWNRSFSVNQ
jgi:hypothetical protein